MNVPLTPILPKFILPQPLSLATKFFRTAAFALTGKSVLRAAGRLLVGLWLGGLWLGGLWLGTTATAAEPLQLPPAKPEQKLAAPAADALGTRPDGVGLAAGSPMPAFTLSNAFGKPVSSAELQQHGALLIVFYRGGWCPYCNLQIRQLTEAWPEFQRRKVTPVLISVDQVDAAALAQRSYDIPFPVLSDPALQAHDAFKVTMTLDAATYQAYRGYGLDIEQWSGRDHHKFAVASAFLVDTSGTIRWAHASPDYKVRPSPAQLLAVIDQHLK